MKDAYKNRLSVAGAPEEKSVHGRIAYVPKLWLDENGKRFDIIYKLDSKLISDQIPGVEKLMRGFSDSTCLNIKKEKSPVCDSKEHPMISFRTPLPNTGCGQFFLCNGIGIGGCPQHVSNNIVMIRLGLTLYKYRGDANKYIYFNDENVMVGTDPFHLRIHDSAISEYHACVNHTLMLPLPFDFLSSLMDDSRQMADWTETRPNMVTVDPRNQYLLDYHVVANLPLTHFDKLAINTLYKCTADWASDCKKNGKEAPKCKNFGYISKQCHCLCSPGFTGATCENKIGRMFPLQKGAYEIEIKDPQVYDFRTLNMKPVDSPSDLKHFVYVTVLIRPSIAGALPSVKVFLPFENAMKTLNELQDDIVKQMSRIDCARGPRMLWGDSDHRRLACECFSTLVANEKPEDSRLFRSRHPRMAMTLINGISQTYYDKPLLSVQTSEFQLTVEFSKPKWPNATNRQKAEGSSTPSDLISVTGATSAMTAAGGSMIGLIVAAVLLMLLCCLLLFFLKRRKRKPEEDEELGTDEEDEESGATDDEGSSEGNVE